MHLKDFIDNLTRLYDEIKKCHHLKGKEPEITFILDTKDENFILEVMTYKEDNDEFLEIEPTRVPGCGCWDGAEITFKIKEVL